ncbi:hypothetical protein [Arcobacter sp. LA11]|uniref:hypothetical protein n=1 Tax=Arcobacter sp. LA11 TaxID=1898176 RepID=UPI000933F6D5|nr:hypothetical protein [Arcobacter sp. LA11]
MVLEYKFEYLSNNNTLVTFLDNILKKRDVNYKILRDENYIFLYIEDEDKKLLTVSDILSNELPMSIFLKNFTLEVVPEIPKKDYTLTLNELKLPHCSNCLVNIENEESTDFYNPFFDCDICGTTCDVSNLKFLKNGEEIKYKNYKELFAMLALKISENNKIKIKTSNGDFVYSKLNKELNEDSNIICTDINELSRLVVSTKEKTVALLSIEKPIVNFNINQVYKNNNNLNIDKINIRYPNNLILYLLSKELSRFGICFLEYEESKDYDCELVYTSTDVKSISPKIVINDSKIMILENENYDKKLEEIYDTFDEKAKGQFMVLLEENNLSDKSILNLFSSTKYDDNICLYSNKIDGMLDILNYKIPETIKYIFEEISKDEIGKKLIENYKTKFPNEYENALNYDISKFKNNSIFSLWNIAAIILGIKKDDSSKNIIFENASNAILEKGPRVDYKLLDSQKIFSREFNINKFIQSGISFKLAGVDDKTLSLGYVESFSYYLANIVDEVNSEFEIDGVSLCGDMISNELFYKLIKKAITKNFKIYYNKDFPIQK